MPGGNGITNAGFTVFARHLFPPNFCFRKARPGKAKQGMARFVKNSRNNANPQYSTLMLGFRFSIVCFRFFALFLCVHRLSKHFSPQNDHTLLIGIFLVALIICRPVFFPLFQWPPPSSCAKYLQHNVYTFYVIPCIWLSYCIFLF